MQEEPVPHDAGSEDALCDHIRVRGSTRREAAIWSRRLAGLSVLACVVVASALVLGRPRGRDAMVPAYHINALSPPVPISTPQAMAKTAFPLQRSKDGRHLVDRNNLPFLVVGDSPQALIANLSETDAAAYFATRHAQGFNAVWINMLCNAYTGCRSDGSTYDGILPFTIAGDLSTPNPAYFRRVDDMLRLATRYGMAVFLDPIETGGWLDVLHNNGVAKDGSYGRYLGHRYRNFPNIIWLNGNDFQSWRTPPDDADARAVAQGIQAADPNHLQTVELNYYASDSLQDPSWAPIIGLDAAYSYFPTYAEVLQAYDRSTVPVVMVEANYEGEHNASDLGSPSILRRQEYWTMLSGGTGQIYGNHYIWPFRKGWQQQLDTEAIRQLRYATALFASHQWYNLIPDQNHRMLTAGYGTFNGGGALVSNDYATAALTSDNSLALVYLPTRRAITLDMSNFSGSMTAWWYDPTSGVYSKVTGSPFASSGSRVLTSPGNNSEGSGDWVLVLEATPAAQ